MSRKQDMTQFPKSNRAVFAVSGGALVVNLEDPSTPFAQAYFPAMQWYKYVAYQDTAYCLSGLFGIKRFDLAAENLP